MEEVRAVGLTQEVRGMSLMGDLAAVELLVQDVGGMPKRGELTWAEMMAMTRGRVSARGERAWSGDLELRWQLWELEGGWSLAQARVSAAESVGDVLVARLAHALPDAARRLSLGGGEWAAEMTRPYRGGEGRLVCTSSVATWDRGLAGELERVLRECVG